MAEPLDFEVVDRPTPAVPLDFEVVPLASMPLPPRRGPPQTAVGEPLDFEVVGATPARPQPSSRSPAEPLNFEVVPRPGSPAALSGLNILPPAAQAGVADAQLDDYETMRLVINDPSSAPEDKVAAMEDWFAKYGRLPAEAIAERAALPRGYRPGLVVGADYVDAALSANPLITVQRKLAARAITRANIRSLQQQDQPARHRFLEQLEEDDPRLLPLRNIVGQLDAGEDVSVLNREALVGIYFSPTNLADPYGQSDLQMPWHAEPPKLPGSATEANIIRGIAEPLAAAFEALFDQPAIWAAGRAHKRGELTDVEYVERLRGIVGDPALTQATAVTARKEMQLGSVAALDFVKDFAKAPPIPFLMSPPGSGLPSLPQLAGIVAQSVADTAASGAGFRDALIRNTREWVVAQGEEQQDRETEREQILRGDSRAGLLASDIAFMVTLDTPIGIGTSGPRIATAAGRLRGTKAKLVREAIDGAAEPALRQLDHLQEAGEGVRILKETPEAARAQRDITTGLQLAVANIGTIARAEGKGVTALDLSKVVKVDEAGEWSLDLTETTLREAATFGERYVGRSELGPFTFALDYHPSNVFAEPSIYSRIRSRSLGPKAAGVAEEAAGAGRFLYRKEDGEVVRWVPVAAERARRLISLDSHPYAVLDIDSGKLRRPTVADVVPIDLWDHFRHLARQREFNRRQIMARFGEAASKLLRGTDGAEDRRLVRKALELFPEANRYKGVDLAAQYLDALARKIDEAIEIVKPEAAALERLGEADPLAKLERPVEGADIAEGLGRAWTDLVAQQRARGEVVEDLLRSIHGTTAEEIAAVNRMRREIDGAMGKVRDLQADARVQELLQGLTVSDVRRIERTLRRGVEIPDRLRPVVEHVRRLFDEMYDLMKAEGILARDHDRAAFYERMAVEGYVSHVLSRKGQRLLRRFKGKLSGEGLAAAKQRLQPGTIEDVNADRVDRIAGMLLDEDIVRGRVALPEDAVAREAARRGYLDQIIEAEGLDQIRFFEEDLGPILHQYGDDLARTASSRIFLRDLMQAFPEGEGFAAELSRATLEGVRQVDLRAAEAGFRRMQGAEYIRTVVGRESWEGWSKHKGELEPLLRAHPPGRERFAALVELLRRHGITGEKLTDKIQDEAKLIATKSVYLPTAVADVVEYFARAAGVVHIPFWDDFTTFLKGHLTVLALAFHGRNAVSNVVQNLLVHGPGSLAAMPQAYELMVLPDDALITIGRNTWTAKQTRDLARRNNVLTDDVTQADLHSFRAGEGAEGATEAMRQARIRIGHGARVAAAGTAAGAVGGGVAAALDAATSPEGEAIDPFKAILMGALLGGTAGVVGAGGYDLYLAEGARTLRRGFPEEKGLTRGLARLAQDAEARGSLRRAMESAWDETLTGVVDGLRRARDAAVVPTAAAAVMAATGAAGPAVVPLAALAVMGAKFLGDGGVMLAAGLGQGLEQHARLAGWIAGLNKGLAPDIAALQVNRALFDYGALTPFERHVMRRLFPFWTWTSKNVRLQAWLANNHPRRYLWMWKGLSALMKDSMTSEDWSLIPRHLRYRFALQIGQGQLLAGAGLPLEDSLDLLRWGASGGMERFPVGLTARLNPGALVALQYMTGHHLYYNVPLDRFTSGRDLEFAPEWIKDFVGYRKYDVFDSRTGKKRTVEVVGHFRDPGRPGVYVVRTDVATQRMLLLRSHPSMRLVGEFNKVAKDTYQHGVQEDRLDRGVSALRRVANVVFGAKTYDLPWEDRAEAQEALMRRYERALREALVAERHGAFEMIILPKEPTHLYPAD